MTFLDTNVLVYSVDGKEPIKQPTARSIVARAIDEGQTYCGVKAVNPFK